MRSWAFLAILRGLHLDYADFWNYTRRNFADFDRLYSHTPAIRTVRPPIVDVGGGDGRFLKWQGQDGLIIDVSESGLAKAEKLGYDTLRLDLRRPVPEDLRGTFETAFCLETLEHIRETGLVLANCNSLLRPGGALWVTVPNKKIDGKVHVRKWKWRELVSDLEKAGFCVGEDFSVAILEKPPHPGRETWMHTYLHHNAGPFVEMFRKLAPDTLTSAFIVKALKVTS